MPAFSFCFLYHHLHQPTLFTLFTLTMKFSTIFAFGLASLSVASPIEKREAAPLTSTTDSVTSAVSGLDSTLGLIVSDVVGLLGKVVTDVEDIASAAGVDVSGLLDLTGISLTKRSEPEDSEVKRSVLDVTTKVEALITDVLGELVTLSTTSGVNLVGSILSVLKL